MMGALVEIQKKGDSMLEGIRRQREVLEQLERKAELADRRRAEAELLATEMEQKMHSLEEEVGGLRREKDALVLELEEDEIHMTRLEMLVLLITIQVINSEFHAPIKCQYTCKN